MVVYICNYYASTRWFISFVGKPAIDPYPKNPLLILREHIVVNDFRIIDMLQKADTEGTLSVTPDQFAEALEVCDKDLNCAGCFPKRIHVDKTSNQM